MKKLILSIIAFSAVFYVAKSQDCTYYFPVKQGSTLEMKSYDAKDKEMSTVKEVVLNKSNDGVKFSSEVFDKNGKSVSKGDYEVKCKNGEFVVDMSNYTRGIDLSAYKDMEIKVETEEMSIPSKPSVGQTLKDGSIKMKISNSVMTVLNMSMKITNRKVEGYEDVTTPAGTFKCLKITYDYESKMVFTVRGKGIEWISDKVGMVKSESYSEKGKIQSHTLLTSFKE